MFTKMQIAKEAASITLSAVSARVIATVLVNHTDMEEGTLPLTVTSAVGGFLIANRFRAHTDAIVENVGAKLSSIGSRKTA